MCKFMGVCPGIHLYVFHGWSILAFNSILLAGRSAGYPLVGGSGLALVPRVNPNESERVALIYDWTFLRCFDFVLMYDRDAHFPTFMASGLVVISIGSWPTRDTKSKRKMEVGVG